MARYSQSPRAPAVSGEWIAEGGRIANVFRAIARDGGRGRVVSNGAVIRPACVMSRPGSDEGAVRWSYAGPRWSGTTRVEIGGRRALYRCSLEFGDAMDGRVTTALPQSLERVRLRREARTTAPPGVSVRIALRDGRVVERTVGDISWQGLSFVLGARDSFVPGDDVHEAHLNWQGRLRVRVRLAVRHVSERLLDGVSIAGAAMTFDSDDDAENLQIELQALVSASTRTGGSWTKDIWDLFERSGYFSLSRKKPEDFAPLEAAFRRMSRKLAGAPDLGVQVVWPSSRGLEASASVAALNRTSVFLYHVARRHGDTPTGTTGRTILFDVYQRAIEWISLRSYAQWVVVWVQDVSRLPKRIHLDFVKRHEPTHKACATMFRAIEVSCRPKHDSGVRIATSLVADFLQQMDWNIREVRPRELEQLSQAASSRWPSCMVAALDLVPPFETRYPAWEAASIPRQRQFLVAELRGQAQALAVVEYADDGLHLFGLFDVVRILPIGRSAEDATANLIEFAKGLFAARGKSAFIYACESESSSELLSGSSQDLGVTHCTVMSTELLPDFAEHVWELMHGSPD